MALTNKQRSIQLLHLNKTIAEIAPVALATAKKMLSEDISIKSQHIDAAVGTSCILVNGLAQKLLAKNGIQSTIVGGRAAFSVNKSQFGIIDFGYGDKKNALTITENCIPYYGHCWLYIKTLDVIVDLTINNLKATFNIDNERRGITNCDFKISTEIVFDNSKTKPFQKLFDGDLGRNYERNSEIHHDMLARLEKAKAIFSAV